LIVDVGVNQMLAVCCMAIWKVTHDLS